MPKFVLSHEFNVSKINRPIYLFIHSILFLFYLLLYYLFPFFHLGSPIKPEVHVQGRTLLCVCNTTSKPAFHQMSIHCTWMARCSDDMDMLIHETHSCILDDSNTNLPCDNVSFACQAREFKSPFQSDVSDYITMYRRGKI